MNTLFKCLESSENLLTDYEKLPINKIFQNHVRNIDKQTLARLCTTFVMTVDDYSGKVLAKAKQKVKGDENRAKLDAFIKEYLADKEKISKEFKNIMGELEDSHVDIAKQIFAKEIDMVTKLMDQWGYLALLCYHYIIYKGLMVFRKLWHDSFFKEFPIMTKWWTEECVKDLETQIKDSLSFRLFDESDCQHLANGILQVLIWDWLWWDFIVYPDSARVRLSQSDTTKTPISS